MSARLPRHTVARLRREPSVATPPAKPRLVIVTAARAAYERLRADILRCALAPSEPWLVSGRSLQAAAENRRAKSLALDPNECY